MDLDVSGVLAAARNVAASRMRETCQVSRKTDGQGVRDPETGTVIYPPPRVLYGPDMKPHGGKCRVRMANAAGAAMVDAGGLTVMQQTQVSFPADVALERNDVIEVLQSDNPLLVGAKFTIRALPEGSQQSANRYGVEAVH